MAIPFYSRMGIFETAGTGGRLLVPVFIICSLILVRIRPEQST